MMNFAHYIPLLLFLPLTLNHMIWNKPNDWNAGLPSSIQVFQTNSSYTTDIPMTAAYCKIDLSDPDLELKVVYAEGANTKTLQQFVDEEPSLVYMAVNGGYFNIYLNKSTSLLISKGRVISGGTHMIARTKRYFLRHLIRYYATRGAFGIYPNGSMEVAWAYQVDNQDIYTYSQPAPNCIGCPLQPMPNRTYPEGGKRWDVIEAIGAGPVIVKNGVRNANDSLNNEAFRSPEKDVRNPRTGICITHDGKLITIAVDGRYPLSGGLFIDELGGLMQELGCKDALNLDGGSSTTMIVNGYLVNRPSHEDGMRNIVSAFLLVSKSKSKL